MNRQRGSLFYGLAVLLAVVMVSCAPPQGDLPSEKPAQTAAPAAAPQPVVDAAPAPQPKPFDIVKQEPVEPAPKPAKRPAPAPIAAAAPAPAPVAPPPQQTASNEPTTAPIALPPPQAEVAPPTPVSPPPPPEPTIKKFTVPAGTEVYIRMIDSIDTETSHANQTYKASLDKPIMVGNDTVFPRRSDVFVKVTDVQSAGKLSGTSQLKVQLDRLFIGKDPYTVTSNTFEQTGSSEGKKAVRNVGIGAAVGGVLGGILGGKTGAVIGAGAGGGGGAVVSKGEQVKINSETQLMFKLENPLDVTLTIPPPGSAAATSGPAKLVAPNQSGSQVSSATPGDLTGNWTVTTDGAQYMTLQLSLRQNSNNLQGTITDPRGYGTIPIRGSINGNYVTFYTQTQYGTNNFQMQFSGAVQGDAGDRMGGNVTLPSNNNNNSNIGGFPGGGYPGGGRNRTRQSTIQAHWNATRN